MDWNWKDLKDMQWKDVKKLRKFDREDLLNRIGLAEHDPASDFFSGLGLFAVGILVGAGLGILFAPRPGAELRTQVTERIKNRGQRQDEFPSSRGAEQSSPVTSRIS
ncbi:MAG: YtxH domain-containing protein [Anaeromyxobacteraceae bacterium]